MQEKGLIPGSGRSPGGGDGNPLQYSHLGNPMDRGAWRATVPRLAKSQMQLSKHTHAVSTVRIKYRLLFDFLLLVRM